MITSGNSYKHLHPRLTGRAGQTVVFSTVCLGFIENGSKKLSAKNAKENAKSAKMCFHKTERIKKRMTDFSFAICSEKNLSQIYADQPSLSSATFASLREKFPPNSNSFAVKKISLRFRRFTQISLLYPLRPLRLCAKNFPQIQIALP
jgi:hypothetical protein